MENQERILNMVKEGTLTPEEAKLLLNNKKEQTIYDKQKAPKGKGTLLEFIAIMTGLFIILTGILYFTGSLDNIITKPANLFIEETELDSTFVNFLPKYTYTFEAKRDMKEITITIEYLSSSGSILYTDTQTINDLLEGESYTMIFDIPFDLNINSARIPEENIKIKIWNDLI